VSISSTFFAPFFRTNVVLAAFFLLMCVLMYVKKAAETTFVRKKRAKNVDEIDGRGKYRRHFYWELINMV
jgi:hypothetical protein